MGDGKEDFNLSYFFNFKIIYFWCVKFLKGVKWKYFKYQDKKTGVSALRMEGMIIRKIHTTSWSLRTWLTLLTTLWSLRTWLSILTISLIAENLAVLSDNIFDRRELDCPFWKHLWSPRTWLSLLTTYIWSLRTWLSLLTTYLIAENLTVLSDNLVDRRELDCP